MFLGLQYTGKDFAILLVPFVPRQIKDKIHQQTLLQATPKPTMPKSRYKKHLFELNDFNQLVKILTPIENGDMKEKRLGGSFVGFLYNIVIPKFIKGLVKSTAF